jgi:hypothetical protein
MPLIKEIETLSRLHAEGILSDIEFRAAKEAILNEVPEAEEAEEYVNMVTLLVEEGAKIDRQAFALVTSPTDYMWNDPDFRDKICQTLVALEDTKTPARKRRSPWWKLW